MVRIVPSGANRSADTRVFTGMKTVLATLVSTAMLATASMSIAHAAAPTLSGAAGTHQVAAPKAPLKLKVNAEHPLVVPAGRAVLVRTRTQAPLIVRQVQRKLSHQGLLVTPAGDRRKVDTSFLRFAVGRRVELADRVLGKRFTVRPRTTYRLRFDKRVLLQASTPTRRQVTLDDATATDLRDPRALGREQVLRFSGQAGQWVYVQPAGDSTRWSSPLNARLTGTGTEETTTNVEGLWRLRSTGTFELALYPDRPRRTDRPAYRVRTAEDLGTLTPDLAKVFTARDEGRWQVATVTLTGWMGIRATASSLSGDWLARFTLADRIRCPLMGPLDCGSNSRVDVTPTHMDGGYLSDWYGNDALVAFLPRPETTGTVELTVSASPGN